jgi:hypothetical protein
VVLAVGEDGLGLGGVPGVEDEDRVAGLARVTAGGTVSGGLAGLRVQQAVLWERYHDQVNLLRASIGGRSTTLVFANGDPPREV